MDDTLAKLAGFVSRPDAHLACAAAVVLAELAPREEAVTEALAAALAKADTARRPFLIEALGRIGTPDAAAALAPLIRAGGLSGDEALRAVAHAGAGALRPLVALLKDASPELRPKLAEAISRAGQAHGFAALLAEMRAGDPEETRAVAEGIRHALPGLDPKSREALARELLRTLDAKSLQSNEAALTAVLEVLGAAGVSAAESALLAHARKGAAPGVRRAALLALAKLELTAERRAALAVPLLPMLEEGDLAHVIEPALAALARAALGLEHRRALHRLLASPHPPVREFAMQALAAQGSSRSLAELLGCLDDPDPRVVDEALEALARAPQAAGPLAQRLLKTADAERRRRVARALAVLARDIPPALVRKLAQACVARPEQRAGEAAGAPDERRGPLLTVLRATGSAELAAAALKEARALRLGGEPLAAVALLRAVSGAAGWSAAHSVEQALAGLAGQPLDMSRAARQSDSSLRLLETALQDAGVKPAALAAQLLRDRAVSQATLHYIGCHFSERILKEREFGAAILKKLAANTRTEEGRQAKEKLILEGLAKAPAGARRGLLEVRAQALRAADDMAAALQAREGISAKRARRKVKASNRGRRPASGGR